MSSFTLLFILSLISFALRNQVILKAFALIGLVIAGYMAFHAYPLPLEGFSQSGSTMLFEIILFIVTGAYIFAEEERINITQALFLSTASVALLESATVLSFILSFESLSIISFVIVSHIKTATQAQGAMKMFIAGSIATALIVLGASFYLFEGHSLTTALGKVEVFGSVGIWIMFLGLFYKLTIVPMHTWAADSYAQIKPSHAALLSGIAKTVAFLAVFKIFTPFLLEAKMLDNTLLIAFALITMTLGNLLALYQKQITKILSYSSIAHAGYMMLAFVAVKSSYASTALLYIAIAYIFMQTALFMLIDKIANGSTTLFLDDLKGYVTQDKTASLIFTVQLFSLAGIPLLAGFLSKAILVYAVVDVDLPLVALLTLLNSALSVGYYAWIVKHIYFDTSTKESDLIPLRGMSLYSQIILITGTLYFGIFAYTVFSA